jgi:hypothetical protein
VRAARAERRAARQGRARAAGGVLRGLRRGASGRGAVRLGAGERGCAQALVASGAGAGAGAGGAGCGPSGMNGRRAGGVSTCGVWVRKLACGCGADVLDAGGPG